MRPKLKSDTFFVPVEDGIYVRNNEQSIVMKGRTLSAWMERLAPLLDGAHTLEQICSDLAPEKQAMIHRLVTVLSERGYVKDVANDLPHTLSIPLQHTYAPAITFIDYHTGSGAHYLQQFLDLPLLAIGSGDNLVALTHALLETGNHRLHVLDTGEEPADTQRMQDLLRLLQDEQDPELTLSFLAPSLMEDAESFERALASFKIVLFFSSASPQARLLRLAETCYRVGAILLPAIALGREVLIGPAQLPGTPGCWQCFWRRRLDAQGLAMDADATLRLSDACLLGPAARAMTANLLAFECFKLGTGVHHETLLEHVFVLELERLETSTHRVFAHPLCTLCSAPPSSLQDEIAALRESDTRGERIDFLRQTEQWVDEYCGLFTRIEERDFVQLPLIRSRIILPPGLPAVSAASLTYQETRELAIRRAVSVYLEHLPDPRRLLRASYAQFSRQRNALHPQQIAGWNAHPFTEEQEIPWLEVWSLSEQRAALVPAAAVYPACDWKRAASDLPLYSAQTGGSGCGFTWAEALARGLLLAGSATEHAPEARSVLSRDACAADSACAAYLTMLTILEQEQDVTLVDLTGPAGIPTIATYLRGRRINLSVHWNAQAAARAALQAAVLHIQRERFPDRADPIQDEPCGAQESLSALLLSSALPRSLASEDDYAQAASALQESWQARGWRILVCPLSGDRTVASAFGCCLRVLLARSAESEQE